MIPMIVLTGIDWMGGFPNGYACERHPLMVSRVSDSIMGYSLIDWGYLGASLFGDRVLGGHWAQFGGRQ